MTATVKVLKRKDAASVIVAILIAMLTFQLFPTVTAEFTNWLTGVEGGFSYAVPGADWKTQYLNPIVAVLVQLVLLELVIRAYGLGHALVAKKK